MTHRLPDPSGDMLPSILLVEDELEQRAMLAGMLESEGYRVAGVASAEEALDRLKEAKPDMIVTDVKLPGMDGFTLYEKILQQPASRQIPFLFITGYTDQRAIEAVKTLGAVAYITKPYDLEDLLHQVKEVLPPGPLP